MEEYDLVKYTTAKKRDINYVGCITIVVEGTYTVTFLCKVKDTDVSFQYPDNEDIDIVDK